MSDSESSNITSTNTITAIVLASGLGSRFGGKKLLHKLIINDKPPLALGVISALNVKPFVDHVICIVQPEDKVLKQQFEFHDFTTVDNPDFKQGLSSSIKAGIRFCQNNYKYASSNHYMICLADMPYIEANTYKAVTKQFKARIKTHANTIIRPVLTDNKKAGHPVIFSNKFETELLNLSGDDGGKPIVKQHGVDSVIVDDAGVLADIDRKTDIHKQG